MSPRAPTFTANFDSTTAMVRAVAAYLHGHDFPALGLNPLLKVPAARANLLPKPLRKALYLFSGWKESLPPRRIDKVKAEGLSEWVSQEYPERTYPAVAIGSSNGAGVHLYSALGIPWLPQTFLVPVRQSVDPDEPKAALTVGIDPGRELLKRNPELQLHHMHDANQDRIMIREMTYFRVKRRKLGERYERFLEERLPPGGTLLVTECERTWPVVRIGEHHVFQHGALGGATEEEFYRGSKRVEDYLERHDSPHRVWDSPQPDERAPEAEWGFDPILLDDIRRIARENGYRIIRMRFPEPQSLSPLVADLYRWWYAARGIPADRLLAESFIVLEPWWTLVTGSVPFWMEFNMEPSLEALRGYLDSSAPFREIWMMLFNHGVEAVGLPTIDSWEEVLARATEKGGWVGADTPEFPMDYAQFARYHTEIQKLPGRYPLPDALTLGNLAEFLDAHGHRYSVDFEEETPGAAA